MNNQEQFNYVYDYKSYPNEFKDYLYPIYEKTIEKLRLLISKKGDNSLLVISPVDIISYVVEESLHNLLPYHADQRIDLLQNSNYQETQADFIAYKLYINEFYGFYNPYSLSDYSPLITSMELMLNLIFDGFNNLKKEGTQERNLLLDILKKGFNIARGILTMLTNGLYTEALSTWRTMHEVECIAKILSDSPYLTEYYLKHMKYTEAFHKNDEASLKIIDEVHKLMEKVNLKKKDTKKYIEYGWLFHYKNLDQYEEFRPTFRKGIELIAGLENYSSLYELSSEIAHSSPLLIFSNDDYYKDVSLMNLYESFFRLEEIFYNLIKDELDISYSYIYSRNKLLQEIKKNIEIQKVIYNYKYSKKANQE